MRSVHTLSASVAIAACLGGCSAGGSGAAAPPANGGPSSSVPSDEASDETADAAAPPCADVSSDTANCGSCGTRCTSPAHGTAVCRKGTCGATCDAGYHASHGSCVADASPDNPPPLACGSDAVDCGGVCQSLTNDPLHCGSCNTVCAVPSGGSALCDLGQCRAICPVGTALTGTTCQPVAVGSIAPAISASDENTCGLTGQGAVYCWGQNTDGQVGNGTVTPVYATSVTTSPSNVIGLGGGITKIRASGSSACAITGTGAVKCWGSNNYGQLGAGAIGDQSAPVDVSSLVGIKQIAGGVWHFCALTNAGGVKCWGRNAEGQLGTGTTQNANTPVDVPGLTSGVVAVAAGGLSSCAILTGGGVKCWGSNSSGTVGNGSTALSIKSPADVSGLTSGVVSVAIGGLHACALTTAGAIKCWGYNADGQLGDGTMTKRTTPVDVQGLPGAMVDLDANDNDTCARHGSTLYCWGDNNEGQLGDGKAVPRSATPLAVPNLTGVTSVSVGAAHICAGTTAGFKCWGRNYYGQLGNGTTTNALTPVAVVF